MHTELTILQQFIPPLPEPVWHDFAGIWQPFEAKRKVILTAESQVERYVYFVLSGVQRAYHLDRDGREATLVFTYAPSFGGVADSFLLQQPSRYWYETLTPSTFLRATFTQLDVLMQQHHALERMMRLLTSQALADTLTRQIELQSMSAEDRFRVLLQRSPQLLQLVPHKYIANYLGMDATNFSKFLGTIRV
jgi:CRP-like cAMP-binding protein